MISGYNTDIEYKGVTYHVQTEDKGIRTPMILSLVYLRGTIVAAKRTPYNDLINNVFDEKVLEKRLRRQHKLMCAAINAGRIEDLKKLTSSPQTLGEAEVESVPAPSKPPTQPAVEPAVAKNIPMPESEPIWDVPVIEDATIITADEEPTHEFSPIFEDLLLPEEAVEILGDLEEFAPLVDDELKIKLFGREKFRAGERKNLNILVCRGKEDKSVPGASIMIKVLGSDFRPLLFHSKADSNGIATVVVKIPNFRTGRAAILIRAMIGGEEAEYRRVITHPR